MSEKSLTESLSVRLFLEKAAAKTPTPGGGGISALAGALAASMAEMTLSFTAGNPKFADVADEAASLLAAVSSARTELVALVDGDAAGYAAYAAARKLPRSTPDEKSARRAALTAATAMAIEPPTAMLRAMRRLATLLPAVLRIGNPNLKGDTAVAAALLPGAARAASLNIYQNFSALDPDAARDLAKEIGASLAEIEEGCNTVYRQVEEQLCPEPAKDPT